jgi:hypothetical protein
LKHRATSVHIFFVILTMDGGPIALAVRGCATTAWSTLVFITLLVGGYLLWRTVPQLQVSVADLQAASI